jgi:hypothetical protein
MLFGDDHMSFDPDTQRSAPPAVVAVWAVPRSASTAFERMVTERGDLNVLSEPFSVAYYDGPEARSSRFTCTAPEATFAAVRAALLEAGSVHPVFVKDMAYQVLPAMDESMIDGCHHTVLIRDPAWSLPSLARHWPDFSTDEAGFEAAHALHHTLVGAGCDVVVIDAADLRRHPEATVGRWCEVVGLGFESGALNWASGMRSEWDRWDQWHATTSTSTGFLPEPDDLPPVPADTSLTDAIAAARSHYEALRLHALRPLERPTS